MAERTWKIKERKGHFIQIWGLLDIRSLRRPNPDRDRRVAQPRDQPHVPMTADALPQPQKHEVLWGCGEALCGSRAPNTISQVQVPSKHKGLLERAQSTTQVKTAQHP